MIILQRKLSIGFFLLSLAALSGCAYQIPTGAPLSQQQQEKVLPKLKKSYLLQTRNCPSSWDADLEVHVQTTGKDQKFTGYLTTQQPSSVKFIASNPLGQPLVAVTTDGNYFRFLDVLNQQFTHGRTVSYALYTDIAPQFVSGQWANWLAARLPDVNDQGIEVYEAPGIKGFWIKHHSTDNTIDYYLWDEDKQQLSQHLLLNEKEKLLAKFDYSNFIRLGQCHQPTTINISKLPFGSQLELGLNQIQKTAPMKKEDLVLKAPAHYRIKIMP